MSELQKAEVLMYAGKWKSAKRRVDQDVAAGRQPSKDDVARMERYASLGFATVSAGWAAIA